jgi:hypothetical protein
VKKIGVLGLTVTAVAVSLIVGLSARPDMPGPDAAALWEYITKESPYTEWGFWEDHQDILPGNSPHGPFHRVYVNDILLKAESAPVPFGSIQVKESFDANKNKTNITAMYKVEGFNPQAGDWFWARYTLDGKPGPAGKVSACIGCHGVKAANDYILVHTVQK